MKRICFLVMYSIIAIDSFSQSERESEIATDILKGEAGWRDYKYLEGIITWRGISGDGREPPISKLQMNKLSIGKDTCLAAYSSGDTFGRFVLKLVPELPDETRLAGVSVEALVLWLGIPSLSDEDHIEWSFCKYIEQEKFRAMIISVKLGEDGRIKAIWTGKAELGL